MKNKIMSTKEKLESIVKQLKELREETGGEMNFTLISEVPSETNEDLNDVIIHSSSEDSDMLFDFQFYLHNYVEAINSQEELEREVIEGSSFVVQSIITNNYLTEGRFYKLLSIDVKNDKVFYTLEGVENSKGKVPCDSANFKKIIPDFKQN